MNLTVEQIARVAHEVNRAYCESMGDHTEPAWDGAPDFERGLVIWLVRMHHDGLAREQPDNLLPTNQSKRNIFNAVVRELLRLNSENAVQRASSGQESEGESHSGSSPDGVHQFSQG